MPTFTPLKTPEQMGETAIQFFATVRYVLEIATKEAPEKRPAIREAIPILESLIGRVYEILSRDILSESLLPVLTRMNSEERYTMDLIVQEMDYYNTRYRRTDTREKGFTAVDGVEDAKTIKDSFEKFIRKLPRPIKKGLSVLNEILGLAKSIL
jgi:hypothetical protein